MTSTYKTKLRIIVPIEVEADSFGEAVRIVDGVIDNCNNVSVFENWERETETYDDMLFGPAERIERDEMEISE